MALAIRLPFRTLRREISRFVITPSPGPFGFLVAVHRMNVLLLPVKWNI
jgi:hypothetical protein